jgi:SAM-dependent methyltransferase
VSYEDSLAAEKKIYENCVDVHNLPPIFHYWSNRHLLPKLQSHGFTSPTDMFAQHLSRTGPRPVHLLSLGSGNCDLEIALASTLTADFTFDCIDLNPAMLDRGRQASGLSPNFNFITADLNTWTATAEYDAVIANQSLHHVVNLEGLFDQIKQSLRPGGQFLISDMIGRNGHQRWPEALDIVHEFWRKLPPSYRFNQIFGCYEELYQNWDCSVQGFEGVRSQDILPLLLDRFHFRLFLGYGNVIDPFIDRAFGHHFDPAKEWDLAFIDQVHQRDEQELASGRLKPTHMLAVVTNESCPTEDIERFIRRPEKTIPSSREQPRYDWTSWPHPAQQELEIACSRLAETGREIKQRTEWALDLENQLKQRTAWALSLEKDVADRTAWALSVEKDFEDRTAWALRLKQELAEQTARAADLDKLMHSPLYLLKRLIKSIM